MEKEIIKTMLGMVGWNEEEAEGIFGPGGSLTNLMAMILARDHHIGPTSRSV